MKARPFRQRDEDIVARYQRGFTQRSLADEYDITTTRVRQILRRAGVEFRGRGNYTRSTSGRSTTRAATRSRKWRARAAQGPNARVE